MKKVLCIIIAVSLFLMATAITVSAEEKTFLVGLVTDTAGINDQAFNALAWAGLQSAKEELGIEITYLESATEADYAPNLESLYDEGCDLIIANGWMLVDAVNEAASAHEDVIYAIIDSACEPANVVNINFASEQCSYLAGVVAAMMTKTNNVGFVIGMVNPVMNTFGYGYYAGVRDTNPDIAIQCYNTNSYTDAAGGKAAAINMFANGADIVFHAAGGTGIGCIEAAKEQGLYAIGVDQDQSYLAPETVITSAMKRVNVGIYTLCQELVAGTLVGGDRLFTLADGGVGIAPTQTLLTEEAIAAVNAAEAAILAGDIVVPATQEAFDAIYGSDFYTLDD